MAFGPLTKKSSFKRKAQNTTMADKQHKAPLPLSSGKMKYSFLIQVLVAVCIYNFHSTHIHVVATDTAPPTEDVVDNDKTNDTANNNNDTLESIKKARGVNIDVDEEEITFFDLSAATYHDGKIIHFDRFEGYITVVSNIAKACRSAGQLEKALLATTGLFDILPYSLNVLVFPFIHPNIDNGDGDVEGDEDGDDEDGDDEDGDGDAKKKFNCDEYDATLRSFATDPKYKNKLYIMEELATLNDEGDGSTSAVHPVYKYLKSKFDMEELSVQFGSFFFVYPQGERIDFVQGHSFKEIKDWIKELTKKSYDEL